MTPTRWSRTRREQVLAILQRAPWSSAADLAAETLLTEHSIRRLLGELEAAGKVAMRLESMRERDRRVAAWKATQAPWRAHPGGVNGRRFLFAISDQPTPESERGHPDGHSDAGTDEQPDPHAERIRERNRKRLHDQFNAHLKWRQRQWQEGQQEEEGHASP